MRDTEQPDVSRFEDVVVPNIGNLKDFAAFTAQDIRSKLPSSQYALYVTNDPFPENWPVEVLRYEVGTSLKDGQQNDLSTWHVNADGKRWQGFYAFCKATYILELKLKPAFIYERLKMSDGTAYIPRVSLLIRLDGRIDSALASWCVHVLKRNLKP
jgi:hypothetical protein